MDKGVKPEEPLFYIGLLIVLIYFLYYFYMDRKQGKRKLKKIQSIENKTLQVTKQHENNKLLLINELTKHYSSTWVQDALKGNIFTEMPTILLKLAMGNPTDITFNGREGQVWKYEKTYGTKLVINIWDDQVTNWSEIK